MNDVMKPSDDNVTSWIDFELFEGILKKNSTDFVEVLNVITTPATKAGDNYASILLRVKVEYGSKDKSIHTVSYILKLPFQSDRKESGFVSLWNFFKKETSMYSKYLRDFEDMYREVDEKINFGPKYYSIQKIVGDEVLLLEDLSQRGFRNEDRRQGLDMAHTKCALQKLAQFHAASAKYVEENGPLPEVFQKGMYSEESRVIFNGMKMDFIPYFKVFEGYEEYKDKLPNLLDNFTDLSIRVSIIDPTEFNVLNHGDFWLNNIMFKHNASGEIEETCFIDFQLCKYGSPAQDLWYFLMSSTELSLKIDSFDYFIQYYHENLIKFLELLKYSGAVPTLAELNDALIKYGYTAFNAFFGVCAVSLLESGENADMVNFSADTPEGRKFRKALFLNDQYKAHAAIVLPWLSKRGCLD